MAKRPQQPEQPDEPAEELEGSRRLFSLVVVGASAGGIEALSTLVGTLAPDFPAPIVVAQHLDPRQPSHLDEILARHCALPVRPIADREAIRPGVVYVVPADRHVEIGDGHLRLLADTLPRPKPSVDRLLSSAARAYGERLIAVILTGTGSDGASGAREVKAAGGTVIIENPETAAYPGMPASLAPTTVDLVADLAQIGPLLRDLLAGTLDPAPPPADGVAAEASLEERERALQAVLAQVRERSGISFASYKRPTVMRRLQRRMVAVGARDLAEYSRYLTYHPDECRRLIASFLIKVTEFFRDRELFDTLRERVMPDLVVQARARGDTLRIWSAGCATGEEAYSLAILLAEALGDDLERFRVQIFATDLDEEAIDFARRGIYPTAALAGLPEALIARYFVRLDGNYEIAKRLRGLLVFGLHDLGQRPPFPNIDLVLCRNVLIYFTQELQTRALHLFAFALRDGGYLALGKAETVRPLETYFAPVDGHHTLYRRQGKRVLGPIGHFAASPPAALPLVRRSPRRPRAFRDARASPSPGIAAGTGERVRTTGEWLGNLVLGLPIGFVVVDRRYDIRAINGPAMRLLGIYTAAQGEDLIHLTRSIPTTALRAAIDAAFRGEGTPATSGATEPAVGRRDGAESAVTAETVLGERRHLHITCYPNAGTKGAGGAVTSGGDPAGVAAVLILIEDVTAAVQRREQAAATATRRPLERHASPAREPGDRERTLQSAREEYERLKDEVDRIADANRSLLATVQELTETTLELRRTNEELLVGQEETQAGAEEIKTLNEELQATNEELVTLNEEMEATVEELHTANDDLEARSRELQQSTETLAAERTASEAARARLEAILLSLGDGVLVVDRAGAAALTNAAYDAMFGGTGAAIAAEDEAGRPLPAEAMPQGRAARGETFTMEFSLTAADGTRHWFEANGQPIRSAGTERDGVVAIRDVTERSLQRRLQDEFVALASHELRTPLAPLNTYLQMLSKRLADRPEDARSRAYTDHALHQVRRLTRLVHDLLIVSRLQGGRLTLARERVRLDEMVAQAVEAARTMTTAQTIRLERPDTPLVVDGDAMRLEQVLMNLLTNAVTYAPHSPRIDVRLRRDGDEAEVLVRDEGAGIPAADLPHLFERFYQVAHVEERPSRRGLGLGLYIAHQVVVAHGGRIEVASVEAPRDGHGTAFTIRLPLAPDAPGESPPA